MHFEFHVWRLTSCFMSASPHHLSSTPCVSSFSGSTLRLVDPTFIGTPIPLSLPSYHLSYSLCPGLSYISAAHLVALNPTHKLTMSIPTSPPPLRIQIPVPPLTPPLPPPAAPASNASLTPLERYKSPRPSWGWYPPSAHLRPARVVTLTARGTFTI